MSKRSRLQSTNPDYEVGYGRPPVATRYARGTSGNPRGRPKRKEKPQGGGGHGELSMLHQAVLEAGAQMVEVKRGDRRVKVSAHAAVVGGLIEAARHGNTRAADMFLKHYQEAEEITHLQSVEVAQGVELTQRFGRLIRTEGAAARENEELKARIAELEGRGGAPVVEPKLAEEAVADSYPPPSVALPAAALQVREPLTRSAPEVVRVPPPLAHPKKHPTPQRGAGGTIHSLPARGPCLEAGTALTVVGKPDPNSWAVVGASDEFNSGRLKGGLNFD